MVLPEKDLGHAGLLMMSKFEAFRFIEKQFFWNLESDLILIPSSFFQLLEEVSKSIFQFQEALFKQGEDMIWSFILMLVEPIYLP